MIASVLLGLAFDDPIISTTAAVIAPFYLIAIVFPQHKRHIERARIYPIFIAAMFVSVRLPWLLIPVAILFFGSTHISLLSVQYRFPNFCCGS